MHVVAERNFSRAAGRMGLSQPSVSKHIKNLKILIDADIIDRTHPGIVLNEAGRILCGYARRIVKLRDEAREKIVHLKDTAAAHIFIAASTIPATYIIPAVLSVLKTSHPTLMVHVRSGDSDEVLDMVGSDQVEIGFIGKRVQDPKLVCEALWKDSMVLVAPKGHPLAAIGSITLSELSRVPFVGREQGSATRSTMEERIKASQGEIKLMLVSEMGSSEAVKEAVLSGLGVSIISRACGQARTPAGSAHIHSHRGSETGTGFLHGLQKAFQAAQSSRALHAVRARLQTGSLSSHGQTFSHASKQASSEGLFSPVKINKNGRAVMF